MTQMKNMQKLFAFCVIVSCDPIRIEKCSAPQNDRLNLSFVKDVKEYGKETARNCCKTDFCHSQILVNSLYVLL